MTNKRFWRTTPKQLSALSAAHAEFNGQHGPKIAETVEDMPFLI